MLVNEVFWSYIYNKTNTALYCTKSISISLNSISCSSRILMKQIYGWSDFAIALENLTSLACLFGSRLNHTNANIDSLFKFNFNS